MSWDKVGNWLKNNAGTGASLVGSLLTGNVPNAVAAGISLVSSATGSDKPEIALQELQRNPDTLLKLKKLAYQNEQSIRSHIEIMERIKLEDAQHEHEQTQTTIRNGDNLNSKVRWVRPSHATLFAIASIVYVFVNENPDFSILGMLMAHPLSYAGLRGWDKSISTVQAMKNGKKR